MRRALALLALLAFCTLPAATRAAELEGIEDDVEDGRPMTKAAEEKADLPSQKAAGAAPAAQKSTVQVSVQPKALDATAALPPSALERVTQFAPELFGLLAVGLFIANLIAGKRVNEATAIAWAKTFCGDGAVLDRNFSQLIARADGGTEVLLRESRNLFLFYATGRRFCQSLTAHLDLQQRQDLVSLAWYQFSPKEDTLDIEVRMQDNCMPPMVLAVVNKRLAKALLKEQPDIETFARRLDVTRDRIATWPSDSLVVFAEHPSLFYDLMTDQLLDQVFSKEAFQEARRYFRYLHFTTEPESEINGDSMKKGTTKRVLRFSFVIPPVSRMEEQSRLLVAAMHCIDAVGSYARDGGFSPDHKRRAEAKRKEVEARKFKETATQRQETIEEKRQKKAEEEAERLKRMTPQQRAKYKEKQEKLMQRRQLAKMTRKM